jgi:UDP-N-acetylglucosamine diphosphorylase/glucosamine-1-phosphate N-acetyltransferase
MKKSPVYLYDDPADLARFLPFSASRPIGELRYGAHLLRERWDFAGFGPVAGHLASPHLADFHEDDAPPVVLAPGRRGIFLRSAFVLAAEAGDAALGADGDGVRLVDSAGNTVGAAVAADRAWTGPAGIPADWPTMVLPGKLLGGVWDIIADLLPVLREDLANEAVRQGEPDVRLPAGCTVLGDAEDLLLDRAAIIEPMVVLDTRGGPIWIQAGAEIRSFSRLTGPLVIGRGTRIVGGQLRESSIGPMCIVHGELSNSIFLGYANKSHDGFLGHSIVGRWANLGAGTITSNLKNTYGPIRLTLGSERIDTGMTFLGSLIGDHVKTAIGTMLPTGCVIGTGANLFGTKRPDAAVPAFAWGSDEPGRRLACRMFLQTAARVLPRRQVEFDDAAKRFLESLWRHGTGQPCD